MSDGEHEVVRCLEQALSYRLLSVALRAPDHQTVETIQAIVGALGVSEIACFLGGATAHSLEGERSRVFGHAVRGAITPYETEYGDTGDPLVQGRELGDISAFYRAVGLHAADGGAERIDHVSTECEFMHVLARKEAHGHESGDSEAVAAMRAMARSFLDDHLGRMGPAFFRPLGRTALGFFTAIGRYGEAFLESECRGYGVVTAPTVLLAPEPHQRDEPFSCPDGAPSAAESGGFEV